MLAGFLPSQPDTTCWQKGSCKHGSCVDAGQDAPTSQIRPNTCQDTWLQPTHVLTYGLLCGVVSAVLQCGPRFELRPYQIKLGTVDQAHAENEWVLRAYTRSTKKAKLSVPEEED